MFKIKTKTYLGALLLLYIIGVFYVGTPINSVHATPGDSVNPVGP